MLAELRQEQEQVEEAIVVMDPLARGQGKRRGRPLGSKNKLKADVA